MTKRKKWIFGGSLAILFVGLAAVFGICDLRISRAVYHSGSLAGKFMEEFGILMEPVLACLSGVVLCVWCQKTPAAPHWRLTLAAGLLALGGSLGYCAYEYRDYGFPVLFIVLAFLTAASLIGFLTARRLSRKALWRLTRIAAVTAAFIAVSLFAVTLLKTLWGRVRFRELSDLSEFSRWFLPRGINGNHSFPSGHTHNASSLWALTLFSPLLAKRWQRALCYLIPAVWILLMAVTRVVMGAHYASDTLFAAAITIGLFYPVRRFILGRMSAWIDVK